MQPHHIDHISSYRGMLAVEGWARAGTPVILYRDKPVVWQALAVERPDLVPHFGPGSEAWGFSLRAVVDPGGFDPAEIVLQFPDGTRIGALDERFGPSKEVMQRMTGRFRAATEAGGRVLEIGSRARSGNTYHKLIAPNATYTGLDVMDGPNVHIVGDAHHLSRHTPGPFDFILSISVFEHLLMPWKVALEMNKVMRMGGLAFIQSHPTWPLHEEPWDFWRFSENAWEGLFNAHTGFRVLDRGYGLSAQIVPQFAASGALRGHESAQTFMLSACLVEKVGEPRVAWEAEVGDVYDLAYNHA